MIKSLLFSFGVGVQPLIVFFLSDLDFSKGIPLAYAYVCSLVFFGIAFALLNPRWPDD